MGVVRNVTRIYNYVSILRNIQLPVIREAALTQPEIVINRLTPVVRIIPDDIRRIIVFTEGCDVCEVVLLGIVQDI